MTSNRATTTTRLRRGVSVFSLLAAIAYLGIVKNDQYRESNIRAALRSGDEIAFVFIASSTCHGVQVDGFPAAIDTIRSFLEKRASDNNLGFTTEAVVLDWVIEQGMEFLTGYRTFDQVSIGRNWLNAGAIKYLWRDLPGEPTVPQVVVLRRSVAVGDKAITIGVEDVIARKIGAEEIQQWASIGAPIPLAVSGDQTGKAVTTSN